MSTTFVDDTHLVFDTIRNGEKEKLKFLLNEHIHGKEKIMEPIVILFEDNVSLASEIFNFVHHEIDFQAVSPMSKKTMLMAAIEYNQLEIFKIILSLKEINPNQDSISDQYILSGLYPYPLLFSVTEHRSIEFAKSLLTLRKNDINVNVKSFYGENILHLIVYRRKYTELIPFLFQNFEEIEINSGLGINCLHDGASPLMLACKLGNKTCVDEFLKHPNIDINLQNEFGETALMLAIIGNKASIVKKLLNLDYINVSLICKEGKRAADYAIESIEMSSLFENFHSNKRRKIE